MRSIHRGIGWGIGMVLWMGLAAGSPAAADETRTVLLMPVGGSAPEALGAEVDRTLRKALQEQGFTLREAADASRQNEQAGGQACTEAVCLWRLVRDAHAWGGMVVGLWRSNWPGAEYRLVGSLVGPSADQRTQKMVELTGPVQQAVETLVGQLLRGLQEEAPITVLLDGAPEGASVVVDGRLRGELPVRIQLRPGRHRLAVSRYGHTGWKGSLALETGSEPVHVRFTLDGQQAAKVELLAGESRVQSATSEQDGAAAGDRAGSGDTAAAEGNRQASTGSAATGEGSSTADPLRTRPPAAPSTGRPWWAWATVATLAAIGVGLGVGAGLEASRSGCQQWDAAGVECIVERSPRVPVLVGLSVGVAASLGGATTMFLLTDR